MDFKEATDGLFDRVDHEYLAKQLGVSVASVRQARLKPEAGAHRSPPANWRETIGRLAEERARYYDDLAHKLRHASMPDEPEERRGRSGKLNAAAPKT